MISFFIFIFILIFFIIFFFLKLLSSHYKTVSVTGSTARNIDPANLSPDILGARLNIRFAAVATGPSIRPEAVAETPFTRPELLL